MRKNAVFERTVLGLMAYSLIVAVAGWEVPDTVIDLIGGLSPTARALKKAGGNNPISFYFFFMYIGMTVSTVLLIARYPGRPDGAFLKQRFPSILVFLLLSIGLLVWFGWFLSPGHNYVGTRLHVLIYLASHTRIGLGLIYGAIFTSFSLVLCLVVITLRHALRPH